MLNASKIKLCKGIEVCKLDIVRFIVSAQLECDWKVGSVCLYGNVISCLEVKLVFT